MVSYDYLIIGGGMASSAAVRGIRSIDKSGTIGILAAESYPPYKRPPLSKALWKGDAIESIWLKEATDHATVINSRTAIAIRPDKKEVADNSGDVYKYNKLLLANGGRVRKLPFDVEGIIYYRTYDDYTLLRSKQGSRTVVIGGGFIGSEIAAALAINDHKVTMIFPEDGIGGRVYPPRLSAFLNEYYTDKGVTVRAKDSIEGIEKKGAIYKVKTKSGREILADTVVAGLGIQPNIELAKDAGIKTDNGVIVDETLQTSVENIFAAGDIALFHNSALGKQVRVEHEDNALTMGETAGMNMAGATEQYHHLPFFYSDLFDLGYEAVGELDNRLEIVEDWKTEFNEGVIYYLDKQRVRGVLLWNVWGQVDNARALIAENSKFTKDNVKGRIG